MADVAPTTSATAGATLTFAAASAGGDKLTPNTGREVLIVRNSGGSSRTVNLQWGVGGVVDGVAPAARQITVAAGATRVIGPFNPVYYEDADGKVAFTYSSEADLTIAAVKIDPTSIV
jgi:hypothetical protein